MSGSDVDGAAAADNVTATAPDAPTSQVHLVVCCHGLWGEPAHLNYVAKSLIKRWGGELSPRSASQTADGGGGGGGGAVGSSSSSTKTSSKSQKGATPNAYASSDGAEVVVLNTASNSGIHTYDGIDWCAERVVVEIHKEVERLSNAGRKVTRFSMLGYSLGGLIARYTVGLLYSRNFFDTIRPINFTTFATPHIGVSPTGGLFSILSAFVGSRSLGRTGIQLYGRDKGWHAEDDIGQDARQIKTSLLEAMSKPESTFIRGLSSFAHVDFYANATSDWVVPIRSGALMEVDPWKGWPEGSELDLAGKGIQLEFLKDYPALVTAVRLPDVAPTPRALPIRIFKAVVPQRWPFLLNPYRVPWPFPFNWIGVIFSPIVIPLFLTLVIYKLQSGSRESNKRVKQIQRDWIKGKGELHDDKLKYGEEHERSRIEEVLNETIRGVAEDNVDLPPSEHHQHTNGNAVPAPRSTTTPLALAVTPQAREYLSKKEVSLTEVQQRMQRNLNQIPGLRKHLVFFDNVMNSHAIIICRTPSIEVHRRGQIVVKHYVDHFQV